MRSILKKAAVFLAMALVSGGVLAADAEQQTRNLLERVFSESPENLMTLWLQQIFGTDGEPTLLTHIAGISNVVALALGVVILGYVVVGGVLRTAQEGQVLGRSWSSVWLPIRISLAFGLIVPAGNGAMSTSQHAILGLAQVGNSLAEVAWVNTVDKLGTDVPLMRAQTADGMQYTTDILKALVCANRTYQIREQGGVDNHLYRYKIMSGSILEGNVDTSYYTHEGPMTATGTFTAPNTSGNSRLIEIQFGYKGDCGSQRFPQPTLALKSLGEAHSGVSDAASDIRTDLGANVDAWSDYEGVAQTAGIRAAQPVMVDMLNKLAPAAMAISMGVEESAGSLPGLGGGEQIVDQMMIQGGEYPALNAAGEFIAEIGYASERVLREAVTQGISSQGQLKEYFEASLTQGGWPTAGLWFFQIDKFQNLGTNIIRDIQSGLDINTSPSSCNLASSWFDWGDEGDFCAHVSRDIAAVEFVMRQAAESRATDYPNEADAHIAMQAGCTSQSCADESGWLDNMMKNISVFILNSLATVGSYGATSQNEDGGLASVTNTSGLANPFLTVTAIGTTINTANTLIAASGATASLGAFAAGKSIAGSFGAGGLVGLFHWVQPIALAVMALLAGTGFTLAYLIPFMPIMTWVLMLVNYLQTVIQGFVAAPLAVIQMATPEGEGISGTRMERAWALMAAMVARPPLMIVGLVAAVVLSYVGFAILNAFFWRVAEMSTSISPMSLIALLILYTSFALFVMKRCIEAMRILPDTILDWFSSGVGGAFSDASGATPFQEQSRSMTDAAGGIQQRMLKHGQQRRKGKEDSDGKGDGKEG